MRHRFLRSVERSLVGFISAHVWIRIRQQDRQGRRRLSEQYTHFHHCLLGARSRSLKRILSIKTLAASYKSAAAPRRRSKVTILKRQAPKVLRLCGCKKQWPHLPTATSMSAPSRTDREALLSGFRMAHRCPSRHLPDSVPAPCTTIPSAPPRRRSYKQACKGHYCGRSCLHERALCHAARFSDKMRFFSGRFPNSCHLTITPRPPSPLLASTLTRTCPS